MLTRVVLVRPCMRMCAFGSTERGPTGLFMVGLVRSLLCMFSGRIQASLLLSLPHAPHSSQTVSLASIVSSSRHCFLLFFFSPFNTYAVALKKNTQPAASTPPQPCLRPSNQPTKPSVCTLPIFPSPPFNHHSTTPTYPSN